MMQKLNSDFLHSDLGLNVRLVNENDVDINTLKAIPGASVLEQKTYSYAGTDVIILPDDIFDKLRLPISKGNLFTSSDRSDNIKVIMTPNAESFSLGSVFAATENANFEVAAVLTDPTYVPIFPYSDGMGFEQFYMNYESEYYCRKPYFFTSESVLRRKEIDERQLHVSNIAMVFFDKEKSEDEYQSIIKQLDDSGVPTIDNSSILKRSQKVLTDDFKRRIPPVIAFSVIVLIGVISCSLMITRSMLNKLTIFYCSGATKKECITIAVLQTVIIDICAFVLAFVSIGVIYLTTISNKLGFVLRTNNFRLSALILAATLIISAFAPILLISKANPIELLTKTNNE